LKMEGEREGPRAHNADGDVYPDLRVLPCTPWA
jgi:hypothetical protein